MSWSLRTLKKIERAIFVNSSYLFMHANLINVNYIMKAFFLKLFTFGRFFEICEIMLTILLSDKII